MKVSILSSSFLRKIMYKQQTYSKSLQKFLVMCYCFSAFPLTSQFICSPLSESKIKKLFQGLCDFLNLKDHYLQKRDLVLFSNVKLIVKVAEETGNLQFILPVSPLFLIFYLLKSELTDCYSLCFKLCTSSKHKREYSDI